MGIPESTLDGWTGTGADKGSVDTRNKIYNALRSERSPLEQKDDEYNVHLQGSYRNTTHIRGDSDVDVVARLESAWKRDLSNLTEAAKERYRDDHEDADYTRSDFYDDVVTALEIKFDSSNVTRGNKAIKIGNDNTVLPLDADVVACQDYRVYHAYPEDGEPEYDTGIHFKSRLGNREIINYPRLHHANGVEKMTDTSRNYKETIRMFKNARNKIDERILISGGDAPSYFIECLLSNVSNAKFKHSSLHTRYDSIVAHLEDSDIGGFTEQSEMVPLFDSSDQARWNQGAAEQYITGLRDLWEDW